MRSLKKLGLTVFAMVAVMAIFTIIMAILPATPSPAAQETAIATENQTPAVPVIEIKYAGYWLHMGEENGCITGTTHPDLSGQNAYHREYPVDPSYCGETLYSTVTPGVTGLSCFYVEEGIVYNQTAQQFCQQNQTWVPTNLPPAEQPFLDLESDPILIQP